MSPEDFQKTLDERSQSDAEAQDKQAQIKAVTDSGQKIVASLAAVHDALLASPLSKDKKLATVAQKLAGYIDTIDKSTTTLSSLDFKPLADSLSGLDTTIKQIPAQILNAHQSVDPRPHLKALNSTLAQKDFSPTIQVAAPDLSQLTQLLTDIKVASDKPADFSRMEELLANVESAISGLVFPVANFVLPFKDVNGKAVQVQLDSSGNLPTTGGGGSSGTQYTDGSSTIAHPIGTIPVFDKAGTITAVSSANPLPTSASFSPSGTQDVNLKQVGGATLTIGQQLAAASVPVILPSATITTLTPPSNAGYALDASLTTIDTDLKSNITLHAGTNLIGKVGIDQTTPGTTNAVAATLSAETTKVIGTVNVAASQTIAVTNTGTFAVQATLAAETTKAIGVVRTSDGSGNLLTSTGSALDVNLKTSAASNISTNLAQVNGVTTLAGNGASGTGAQRVTIASDSTGQAAPAANATATGTTIYNNTALSSTKQAVNASAGNLYGYHIYNPNSVVIYIQLFNVASASVTVGTTAPTAVIAVPALGWADTSPGIPITFGTALTIAATTTSTGLSAPTTALLCNIWYK